METVTPPVPSVPRHRDRWSREGDRVSLVREAPAARPLRFDAEPEPLSVDLTCSALLVIDMQNDFLDPDGWFAAVRDADVGALGDVIPRINALAADFRRANAPVIHLNWGVRADLANLPANVVDKGSDCGRRPGYGARTASGEVLVGGSWGAASVPGIDADPADLHVAKHRLSGFRDNELEQILRRLDARTLFYTGVNLDRCVFATLADGCFEGFDAVLVEDATATVSPPFVGEAVAYLVRQLYGFTTTTAALAAAFDSHADRGAHA